MGNLRESLCSTFLTIVTKKIREERQPDGTARLRDSSGVTSSQSRGLRPPLHTEATRKQSARDDSLAGDRNPLDRLETQPPLTYYYDLSRLPPTVSNQNRINIAALVRFLSCKSVTAAQEQRSPNNNTELLLLQQLQLLLTKLLVRSSLFTHSMLPEVVDEVAVTYLLLPMYER